MWLCLLSNQAYVSQTTAWMTYRSRSSFSKMPLPSWCPVKSRHWSVMQLLPSYAQHIEVLFSGHVWAFICILYDQVKDCLDHSALPMDGATLTEALRQRGINVRYLGSVLEFVDKTPAKAQLEHFYVSLNATAAVTCSLSLCFVTNISFFLLKTLENRNQWADHQMC